MLIKLPMSKRMYDRSVALVGRIEVGLPRLMAIWMILASVAGGLRVAFAASPIRNGTDTVASVLPYLLIVMAPIVTIMIALGLFPKRDVIAQPRFRLARFGRWQRVDCVAARSMPLYGTNGFMASLLVGMLINIPVRALEFIAAIPALGSVTPLWFGSLYAMMLTDLVTLCSLYAFAFVMALRHVPLFPRFLAVVWGIDILMQIGIANVMASIDGLPSPVAHALGSMLEGNLKKVLISMAIWLPYLLLSRRVNLTFRLRIPA